MYKKYKTGKNHRTNYVYYSVTGDKYVITPADVDRDYIAALHEFDDSEVNQNRREMDKHMSIYLSDNSFKETVINIIDNASHVEEEAMANLLIGFNFENDTLLKAVLKLSQEEQRIVKLYWFDRLKQDEIAVSFCVSRNAIQKRIVKIAKKLKEIMSN